MAALELAKNIPKWLDKIFFENVIRQYQNDPEAQVIEFSLTPGSPAGLNFGSALFYLVISYKSKFSKDITKLSAFVKTLPEGIDLSELEYLQDSKLFKVETNFYGNVLPAIENLLSSIGDKDVISPRLIYQALEPNPVIILEDLKIKGYETMGDEPPKTFHETIKIIKKLAKFHAAAFYLHSEKKVDLETFKATLYSDKKLIDKLFTDNLKILAEVVESMDEIKQYAPKVRNFVETFQEKLTAACTASNNPFAINLLAHGDFHGRNVIVKRKATGDIEDFIILDYQTCVYASAAVDLLYALHCFMTDENRKEHKDELIAFYHQQFTDFLTKFGYLKAPPSLLDLQIELLRCGAIEVNIGLSLKAFFCLDKSKLTAEDYEKGPTGLLGKAYTSTAFKKILAKDLPTFIFKGIIA